MATVSYGVKIKNRSHAFDKTLEIYRTAVFYPRALKINTCEGVVASPGKSS